MKFKKTRSIKLLEKGKMKRGGGVTTLYIQILKKNVKIIMKLIVN